MGSFSAPFFFFPWRESESPNKDKRRKTLIVPSSSEILPRRFQRTAFPSFEERTLA